MTKFNANAVKEFMVNCRFYVWQRPQDRKWNLYECMYEEGQDVKKRVGIFEEKKEAYIALEEAKTKFRGDLEKILIIRDMPEDIDNVCGSCGHRNDGPRPEAQPNY